MVKFLKPFIIIVYRKVYNCLKRTRRKHDFVKRNVNRRKSGKSLDLYSRDFKHSNIELQNLYHDLQLILNEIKREKYYGSYSTFENSPLHAGKFQFDLWNDFTPGQYLPLKYDWEKLREEVIKYSARNSLLLAPMPTASTSQILGNNECIEPYTSNMYTRRTMAGEFTIINKWLIRDLINIGIWNDDMSEKLMFYRGSVQKIAAT